MIAAKIKAFNFELFNDQNNGVYSADKMLKLHNLKADDIIEIILGSDGYPYDITLEQAMDNYVSDFYFPLEKDLRKNEINKFSTIGGGMYRYSTFPILKEHLIEIYEKN